MMRKSVGTVEFVDLDTLLPSLIAISRLPEGDVTLWMDQNNSPEGGWGGDCEVGFDMVSAQRLLESFREAKKIAATGPKRGWEPVDGVAYSSCDQDDEAPSKPGRLGCVSLLARRGVVRILIVPRREVEDFQFTLPETAAKQLIELLQIAVAA